MRQLLIMRHGKSELNLGKDDFYIHLGEEGKSASGKIGNTLLVKDIVPDVILSSETFRAVTTVRILSEKCDYQKEITFNEAFYLESN
jgi:phosphohistidine phosphatase SixA